MSICHGLLMRKREMDEDGLIYTIPSYCASMLRNVHCFISKMADVKYWSLVKMLRPRTCIKGSQIHCGGMPSPSEGNVDGA